MVSIGSYYTLIPFLPLYSELNENYHDGNKRIPFTEFMLEPTAEHSFYSRGAVILNHLEINTHTLNVTLDFDFIIALVKAMVTTKVYRAVQTVVQFLSNATDDNGIIDTEKIIQQVIEPPKTNLAMTTMIYLKTLNLHSTNINVTLASAVDKVVC